MGAIHGNPSALSLSLFLPLRSPRLAWSSLPLAVRGKSERKNLIMISFRSNEALVLGPSVSYRPAGCPAQGVRRAGSGGGGVAVYRVSHVLPSVCCCCCCALLQLQQKNQQLDFVSCSFLLLLLLLLLCCSPAAVPSLSQLVLALSRYPQLLDSTGLDSQATRLPVRCRGQRIRR